MKQDKMFKDLQLNNIDVILSFIKKENERQIKKWGIQTHNAVVWDTILNEEVGELTKDMLQIYKSEPEKIQQHFDSAFREAIQVATLSLKIAEMLFHEEEISKIKYWISTVKESCIEEIRNIFGKFKSLC